MVEHVIRPINLSWVEMDLSLFTYKMNFGKPKKCVMSSYLIEGPDKYILIDAGVTYDQLSGGYWPKNNEGTKQKQDDMDDIGRGFKMKGGPIAESFEAGLEKLGLKGSDIDYVILTHMMLDHVGNLYKLDKAKFVVQKAEIEFAMNPHPIQGAYDHGLPHWPSVDKAIKDNRFEMLEGDAELTKGVNIMFTPGHSPGTQTVMIDTSKGKVAIPGMCSMKENWNPPDWYPNPVIVCGIHGDAMQCYDSMLKVKEAADIIIPIHDPDLSTVDKIG